mgnify:CR=1 FL=1
MTNFSLQSTLSVSCVRTALLKPAMEFMASSSTAAPRKAPCELELEKLVQYRQSMNTLLKQESHRQASSYHKFLKEMKTVEPFLPPENEIYTPPWRKSMGEVYGMETALKMKAAPEPYEVRARRFAKEEAEKRNRVDGWSRGLHSRYHKANITADV